MMYNEELNSTQMSRSLGILPSQAKGENSTSVVGRSGCQGVMSVGSDNGAKEAIRASSIWSGQCAAASERVENVADSFGVSLYEEKKRYFVPGERAKNPVDAVGKAEGRTNLQGFEEGARENSSQSQLDVRRARRLVWKRLAALIKRCGCLHWGMSADGAFLFDSCPPDSRPDDEVVEQVQKVVLDIAKRGLSRATRPLGPFSLDIAEITNENASAYLITIGTSVDANVLEESGLSERQLDVCLAAARGHTVAQIARALFVSENTVKSHLKRAYAMLGVSSRLELARALKISEPKKPSDLI
jgi:DNA-binding CsgD family transcriptional regulator